MGIENAIFGAGLGIAQSGINALTADYNNELAKDYYGYAAEHNYMYGEKSADRADIRTRLLYNDLYSPQAQMQQIKEAGLSPSLFYGDAGGISGQAGAQGSGAAGNMPQVFGMSPVDLAQTMKLQAETEKIQEETKTEKGTNKRGAAEISQLIENCKSTQLKNVWQEYQNALSEIETTIEASLQDTKIENYIEQTRYLSHICRSAEAKAEVDVKTKDATMEYAEEKTRNLAADTILKKTEKVLKQHNVNLTDAQISDLKSQINVRKAQVEINQEWLESQVQQWAVQNGLQEKINTATIKKLTSDIWQGWVSKFIDLLNTIKR